MWKALALATALSLAIAPAYADDDDDDDKATAAVTTRAEQLPDLVLGSPTEDFIVSQKEYTLRRGQPYRLKVTAAGFKEYMFRAPELFRDSWVRQIVIDNLEVHTNTFYGVEFDRQGTIEIFFTPQRTGFYEWFVPGFEKRGMTGTFQVK